MNLDVRPLVVAALTRVLPALDLADTNAYRLLDEEGLGLTIDRYDRQLVLSTLVEVRPDDPADVARVVAAGTRLAAQVGTLLAAETDAVYLKVRPKQANTLGHARDVGLTPVAPVWGMRSDAHPTIRENGVLYDVRLDDGLPTGIYLDQRDNRAWLLRHARGKRVLNTFAYTCGFSVAAAVGGAAQTVSIDAAAPALAQARQNFQRNGIDDPTAHDLIRGDVLRWLPKLAKRGAQFDVVILDPPSYACVDGARFSVQRDYVRLAAAALTVLAPGGHMLACVNHTGLTDRWLIATVQDAARAANRTVQRREVRPAGVDHPSARMKSVLFQLA